MALRGTFAARARMSALFSAGSATLALLAAAGPGWFYADVETGNIALGRM